MNICEVKEYIAIKNELQSVAKIQWINIDGLRNCFRKNNSKKLLPSKEYKGTKAQNVF